MKTYLKVVSLSGPLTSTFNTVAHGDSTELSANTTCRFGMPLVLLGVIYHQSP